MRALRCWCITVGCLSAAVLASAEAPVMTMTLAEAEARVLETSEQFKAKTAELAAASARTDAQYALLWPKLSLEASWRYISEVASIRPAPNAPAIPLGDHTNYSLGPQLSWTVDAGGFYYGWLAAQASLEAKRQEARALRQELLLKVRLAYCQAQLAYMQVDMLSDGLQLTQAQYADIQAQYQAGASSRQDTLASHLEVLSRQRQLRQARTELAAALRDLLACCGQERLGDLARPWPQSKDANKFRGVEPPTVLVRFDPLEQAAAALAPAAEKPLNPRHPRAQTLTLLAETARQAALALGAGHWPRLGVFGKTSLDYPNGPILETIHQNSVGVNATWSLWEAGRVVNAAAEQERQAETFQHQAAQVRQDLEVVWEKARDRLAQLRGELEINRQIVQETQELAKLVYSSYRTGRAGYLDVQAANLRHLDAQIQASRTQAQTLIQLATLDSLSETGE